jgi:hypothetical protein
MEVINFNDMPLIKRHVVGAQSDIGAKVEQKGELNNYDPSQGYSVTLSLFKRRFFGFFYLLIVLNNLLLQSCSKDEIIRKSGVLQYVNETYDISSEFQDLEVLQLKGDFGFVKLGSVAIGKNKIFAVDLQILRILVFNTQGEFLYEINKRGDGPGEYRGISKISIHDDQLIIFSHYEMAIHKYDLEGNFIEKVVLHDRLYDVVFLKDVFVGFLNQNSMHPERSNLQVYNYNGKLLKQGFPYSFDNAIPAGNSGSISIDYPLSNHFYFAPPMEAEIFKLDEKLTIIEEFKVLGFPNYWPHGMDKEKYSLPIASQYNYIIGIMPKFRNIQFVKYQNYPFLSTGVLHINEQKIYKSGISNYLVPFVDNYVGTDSQSFNYFVPKSEHILIMYSQTEAPDELMPQAIKDNFKNIMSEDFVYLIRKKNN